MAVAAGWLSGAAVAVGLWWMLKGVFALPVFERTNFRGRALPTGAGLIVGLGLVAIEAALTVTGVAPDAAGPRRIVLLAALGFGLLGLLDDLAGVGESGGFTAHVRALARGRLTTGGLKLLGGAAVAVVAAALVAPDAGTARLLADGALIALSGNLANLFDRAPGRVVKVGTVAFVALLAGAGLPDALVGVAVVLGGAAGLGIFDVREQLMLGDAGANVVGAALGLGVVLTCSPGLRVAVLVVVAALNVTSELVSFSRVIDRVPPLRALDRLGRRA
jgi:UDP-N-acetylmuramyl pentapeptide phosphotransferase/UDP-N-acetylglucosamine-1-phosphate transferase